MLEMDDSVPATRPIAQDLQASVMTKSREDAVVDDLLTTLSLVSPTKATQKKTKDDKEYKTEGKEEEEKEAALMMEAEQGPAQSQPPLYNNTKFTQRGALKPQEWSINNSYTAKVKGEKGPRKDKKDGTGESIRDLALKMQATNKSRNNNSAAVSRALDVLNKLDKDPSNIRGDSHYVTEAEAAEISKQRLQQQVSRSEGLSGNYSVGGSGIKKIKDHKESPVRYPAPNTPNTVSPTKPTATHQDKDAKDEKHITTDTDSDDLMVNGPAEAKKSTNPTGQPIYHNHTSVSSPNARRPAALRNKYKSSTMTMSMMGSGDVNQQKSSATPTKTTPVKEAIAPAKDHHNDNNNEKQETQETQDKDVEAISDDEEEDGAYVEVGDRYMNSPEAALGGDDFSSWRENRLDTSQYKGDTMTEHALLNSKPKPRARMHPKGKRAMEIAARAKQAEDEMKRRKAIEEMELALPVGSDPALLDFVKKNDNINNNKNDVNDDKKKGALGDYDNGLRVAKVRQVEWKEPDEAYNKARGMKSVERADRGPTDREKVSRFKQQLLDRQAAIKNAVPTIDVIAKDTKSTKLSIMEKPDATCLPETSIHDKYDTNAIEGHSSSGSVFEDDPADLSPTQKAKRLQNSNNNQLQSAFFSAEGVSATFLPNPYSNTNTNNTVTESKEGEEKDKKNRDSLYEFIDDEEEEEEGEEEGDFDEEAYSDDSVEATTVPVVRKSTFLELWEGYDDMISHCGPIFSKKQRGGQDMGEDAVVYNIMDDPQMSIRRQLSEQENKESGGNTDGYTAAGNAGQGLPVSVNAASSELTLQFLKRGFTSAEAVLNLRESCGVKNTSVYHIQKNRLLTVIDLSRQVPPFSQTGWLVFATMIIDGIVRLRQLCSNKEEWNGKVTAIIEQANARGLSLNGNEIRVLQTFFDEL
jgi:hypothetical protein